MAAIHTCTFSWITGIYLAPKMPCLGFKGSGLKQFPLSHTLAPERTWVNNKVLALTNPCVMECEILPQNLQQHQNTKYAPPDRLQEFFFQVKSTWDLKSKLALEMTLNKSNTSLLLSIPLLPEYLLLQSSLSSKWNFNPKLYKHSRGGKNKYTL